MPRIPFPSSRAAEPLPHLRLPLASEFLSHLPLSHCRRSCRMLSLARRVLSLARVMCSRSPAFVCEVGVKDWLFFLANSLICCGDAWYIAALLDFLLKCGGAWWGLCRRRTVAYPERLLFLFPPPPTTAGQPWRRQCGSGSWW
jgi:hypothetical protein